MSNEETTQPPRVGGSELNVQLCIKPCGGCGETDPRKRCLGCFHCFTDDPDEIKGYIGRNQVALGLCGR